MMIPEDEIEGAVVDLRSRFRDHLNPAPSWPRELSRVWILIDLYLLYRRNCSYTTVIGELKRAGDPAHSVVQVAHRAALATSSDDPETAGEMAGQG